VDEVGKSRWRWIGIWSVTQGGERIAEYLAHLNEGDVMFSDEVVVKDRVSFRFPEKGVGSEGGRRDRKTAMSEINSR